jgi:hypothetical protein
VALLLGIPAVSGAVFAATGLDGLPLLSAGWSVCSLSNDCGDSSSSSAAREAMRLAAALALPLALMQLWRLRERKPPPHRSENYYRKRLCIAHTLTVLLIVDVVVVAADSAVLLVAVEHCEKVARSTSTL